MSKENKGSCPIRQRYRRVESLILHDPSCLVYVKFSSFLQEAAFELLIGINSFAQFSVEGSVIEGVRMRVRWHLVHVVSHLKSVSQKRIEKLLAPINDQLKGW